jgi:putative pyruvate formate lyase activating enzyme
MHRSYYSNIDRLILENCTLCPRECGADRFEDGSGYCGIDAGFDIASICLHRGEEPAICGSKGICNIFFRGCNLHCLYCQNHEISRPFKQRTGSLRDLTSVLNEIEELLNQGAISVGFVSPSHVIPQVKAIINGLHSHGYKPVFVYNTNGYDKAETIRSLDGLIDIYLPDFKYVSSLLAASYSDTFDYPEVALKSIKEMYFQEGSALRTDDSGNALNGLLIRHLVLPGHAEESKLVLKMIAEELSTGISLSLMSQYHPIPLVMDHSILGRSLYRSEYESVVKAMEDLGFRNGWVQDMDSYLTYRPDFSSEHPFK